MICSRESADLILGQWEVLCQLGAVPKALVWDNEGAVGSWRRGRPQLTDAFNAFRGLLGCAVILNRPRDPESKGIVERANEYLETSFLPGRAFSSPQDRRDRLPHPGPQGPHPPRRRHPPGRAGTGRSWTHEEFLVACLQREVSARESHGGEGRIRAARFPSRKALEDFDYDHQRSLKREVIAHLGTLDFVTSIGNQLYQNPPNTQPASWWEQGTRTLAGDRAALWPARPARSGSPA